MLLTVFLFQIHKHVVTRHLKKVKALYRFLCIWKPGVQPRTQLHYPKYPSDKHIVWPPDMGGKCRYYTSIWQMYVSMKWDLFESKKQKKKINSKIAKHVLANKKWLLPDHLLCKRDRSFISKQLKASTKHIWLKRWKNFCNKRSTQKNGAHKVVILSITLT